MSEEPIIQTQVSMNFTEKQISTEKDSLFSRVKARENRAIQTIKFVWVKQTELNCSNLAKEMCAKLLPLHLSDDFSGLSYTELGLGLIGPSSEIDQWKI